MPSNCNKTMIRDVYTEYALDVIEGKILAGKYVRQACQRYLAFMDKYDFRIDKVERVLRFVGRMKHWQGKSAGRQFELLPYQRWIIYSIFGFYHKGTDRRVTHYVYLELARKNGKTALAAAICLYMMVADGEPGSEVELIANSREQAKICYQASAKFAESVDRKKKPWFDIQRDRIFMQHTDSKMLVLSSDATGNDGYNSYCFCLDEAHAMKTSELWDVMSSSQGMRDNYLGMIITTAGFNLFGFCYPYRRSCISVLSGAVDNDSQFSAIYSIDEGDNWKDESVWVKANPSIGTTVTEQYLREMVRRAQTNTREEASVRTKNLNEWLTSSSQWVSYDVMLDATQEVNLEDYRGRSAYIGVDLGAVSDITALSVMIPDGDRYIFWCRYYLPESELTNNENHELYSYWHRKGFLKVTPGNVTDYDIMTNDILEIAEIVLVNKISYDKWNAISWANDCTQRGLPLEPFSQALWSFNRPTKEFERNIKMGKVVIDNNEITRWCFDNVHLKTDHNGNVKPEKGKGEMNKIDGVIAILEAMGSYLESPIEGFGII